MIDITQEPLTEHHRRRVYDGFAKHAIASTGYNEIFDPQSFIAMDGNTFAGSVVCAKFWGALHIKYVYVEDAYRGQGLATQLMNRAFDYGRENSCAFAFVETMSFQAIGFYEKLGFVLEFTRKGFAHGTSFHYLRKELLKE
jgi:ribosomal protein S18 acetylase RimI-like enzyme